MPEPSSAIFHEAISGCVGEKMLAIFVVIFLILSALVVFNKYRTLRSIRKLRRALESENLVYMDGIDALKYMHSARKPKPVVPSEGDLFGLDPNKY